MSFAEEFRSYKKWPQDMSWGCPIPTPVPRTTLRTMSCLPSVASGARWSSRVLGNWWRLAQMCLRRVELFWILSLNCLAIKRANTLKISRSIVAFLLMVFFLLIAWLINCELIVCLQIWNSMMMKITPGQRRSQGWRPSAMKTKRMTNNYYCTYKLRKSLDLSFYHN